MFEKMILKIILEIQDESKMNFTGRDQQGFKHGRSTGTLSLDLQYEITRAFDNDKFLFPNYENC
jgi:uncharacterized protein involved in copper resistance